MMEEKIRKALVKMKKLDSKLAQVIKVHVCINLLVLLLLFIVVVVVVVYCLLLLEREGSKRKKKPSGTHCTKYVN